MAIGLHERPETINGRTDRLTRGAEYWLEAALTHLRTGQVEDSLDAAREAKETLHTLRKHLTGQ